MEFPRCSRQLIGMVCLLASLAACGEGDSNKQMPPPLVVAIQVQARAVPNIVELPGRIEAVRTAEVRARVDGIVQRRLYEEGTDVREGTLLFQIDPRQKEAQAHQAEAALKRMTAARINAAQDVARYKPLVARKAISAQEFDAATSTLRQAEANVADAQAALDNARLELSYTMVRTPLTGRVGRAAVTEGALVSASSATLMTRVDVLNPIYATFTQASASITALRQRLQTGDILVPSLDKIEVKLILESGVEYGTIGHLNFADLSVDPSTGSQTVRAEFPNPQRLLLPGEFVRGRIYAGVIPNGISIPQRAVSISNEEATVMIVGPEDTAESRSVELGSMVAGSWIIRSGLQPGDRVIVEGWQKVRSGQRVQIKSANKVTPKPNAAARSLSQP